MTLLDAIVEALTDLEVYDPGEGLDAGDQLKGLNKFNAWVDQLGTERLAMAAVTRTTPTITAGLLTVTGTPSLLQQVGYLDSAGLEILLGALTDDEYAAIPDKTLTGNPTSYHYNRVTAALTLWPVSTVTSVLYVPTPITEVADVNVQLVLPKGYRRFVVTNLALELAPAFGATPSAQLLEAARDSRLSAGMANPSPPTPICTWDAGMPGGSPRGGFDYRRGF